MINQEKYFTKKDKSQNKKTTSKSIEEEDANNDDSDEEVTPRIKHKKNIDSDEEIEEEDIITKIPEILLDDDFSIFYKGREERKGKIIEPIEEIKTSKDEFFRKLRYFKRKSHEFTKTNEILIHEAYSIDVFKSFINSIKTNKIRLNEKNYSDLYKLSSKYEFYELQQQIEMFSKSRPDINRLINDFSFDDFDSNKEEKLAKNLDICLQNQSLVNFPIPILNRILNSPKRILKNHHLLFNFIKEVMQKNFKNSNNNDDFQVLISSLDYRQMSNEELEELFDNDHFTSVFDCRNSKEQMKAFIEERKFNQARMSQLEEQMVNLNNLVLQKFEALENMERIVSKFQSENQSLHQYIQKLESKLNDIEQKAIMRPITGSITANVESNQLIKGVINLIEDNTKLDAKKSKYVINSKSERELSESEYESGSEIENVTQQFSVSKPAGTYYVHALIVDNFGNLKQIMSGPLKTNGVAPLTFNFTGNVQSTTLEPGNYKLEVWGAEGGKSVSSNFITPGKGGYSVGTLSLKSKTKLFIHVGQSPTNGTGGWNGGGSTSSNYAGGGGATDISLYGSEGSNDWNNSNHLYSRIIVAGGGGGSGNDSQYPAGCGGGASGENAGGCSNSEGTQTRAGVSNNKSKDQGFGIGGTQTGCCSGGGGSGWYGAASSNTSNGCSTGSSGGSGYVYSSSTASYYPSGCKLNSSYYLTNASTICGNSTFPNTSGTGNENGHCGNGFAKITLLN